MYSRTVSADLKPLAESWPKPATPARTEPGLGTRSQFLSGIGSCPASALLLQCGLGEDLDIDDFRLTSVDCPSLAVLVVNFGSALALLAALAVIPFPSVDQEPERRCYFLSAAFENM